MATVIDTFIVELGLDPTKFNRAQQDAMNRFRQQVDQWRRHGQDAEQVGKGISEAFASATRYAMSFGAALLGAAGLKELVVNTTQANLQIGRMSTLMDTNIGTLSRWRNIAEVSGGSGDAMTSSMRNLVQQFQQFAVTGESAVIPYFRALRVDVADTNGHMRNLDDIMLDLADRFSKMDPAKAAFFGHALGFDDATIAMLIRGRGEIEKLLETQKQIAQVSEADKKAADELTASWNRLSQQGTSMAREFVTKMTPAMVYVLDLIGKGMRWLHDTASVGAGELDMGVNSPIDPMTGLPNPGYRPATFDQRFGNLPTSSAGARGGRQTRGDRNHNPGNIEYGPFAIAHGATGTDGRFAIFPTQEAGERAMEDLLRGNYRGLTLAQIQQKWVGNADAGYLGGMTSAIGLGAGDVPDLNNPSTLHALAASMARGEGSHYSSVTVHQMTVNSRASDAAGIANDIRTKLNERALSQQAGAGPG